MIYTDKNYVNVILHTLDCPLIKHTPETIEHTFTQCKNIDMSRNRDLDKQDIRINTTVAMVIRTL